LHLFQTTACAVPPYLGAKRGEQIPLDLLLHGGICCNPLLDQSGLQGTKTAAAMETVSGVLVVRRSPGRLPTRLLQSECLAVLTHRDCRSQRSGRS
jgi:hypothetical protein